MKKPPNGGLVDSLSTDLIDCLITWERYQKDILTRWQIHQYEVQELIKDFQKALDFVTPYHTELVKRVKTVNL